jgi:hypothetical protein
VETVSEGGSRAREPEEGTGEKETTYLGLSTGVTRAPVVRGSYRPLTRPRRVRTVSLMNGRGAVLPDA